MNICCAMFRFEVNVWQPCTKKSKCTPLLLPSVTSSTTLPLPPSAANTPGPTGASKTRTHPTHAHRIPGCSHCLFSKQHHPNSTVLTVLICIQNVHACRTFWSEGTPSSFLTYTNFLRALLSAVALSIFEGVLHTYVRAYFDPYHSGKAFRGNRAGCLQRGHGRSVASITANYRNLQLIPMEFIRFP